MTDFWTEYDRMVEHLSRRNGETLPFKDALLMGGLGIAGEAGEVADIVKKVSFHGLAFHNDIREDLTLELGDVLWYINFLARRACHMSIEEIAMRNMEKLRARYGKSFDFSAIASATHPDEAN